MIYVIYKYIQIWKINWLFCVVFCKYTAGKSRESCNGILKWHPVWRGKKKKTGHNQNILTMSPSPCHLGVSPRLICRMGHIAAVHSFASLMHLSPPVYNPPDLCRGCSECVVHHAEWWKHLFISPHIEVPYTFWWCCRCDPGPCIVHVMHFKSLNLFFRKCVTPFVRITSSAPGGLEPNFPAMKAAIFCRWCQRESVIVRD